MMSVRDEDYRKIFWIGLSVMFVLIGISTVIDAFIRPQTTTSGNYFGWAAGLFRALIDVIWILVFIWIISWFFRWLPRSREYNHKHYWDWWEHDEAVETVRTRYAKGEITREQFDQMKRDLREK